MHIASVFLFTAQTALAHGKEAPKCTWKLSCFSLVMADLTSYQHVYRSFLSISNQLEAGNLDENSLDLMITRVDFYREAVTRFANNQNPGNIHIDRIAGLLGEVGRILEAELHHRYPTEDAEQRWAVSYLVILKIVIRY